MGFLVRVLSIIGDFVSAIDPAPRVLPHRRILAVLVVSAVLIWIDSTVLGIALERLADPVTGLGATPGQLQWAVGVYSLLFATALFLAGALGDRYGHRTVLMTGLLIFGASSAWAAWATGPVALILARATMGLGGALIMPTSMAIIGWTFPPERRGGAIALWSSSAGLGVAVGPVGGAVLIDPFVRDSVLPSVCGCSPPRPRSCGRGGGCGAPPWPGPPPPRAPRDAAGSTRSVS